MRYMLCMSDLRTSLLPQSSGTNIAMPIRLKDQYFPLWFVCREYPQDRSRSPLTRAHTHTVLGSRERFRCNSPLQGNPSGPPSASSFPYSPPGNASRRGSPHLLLSCPHHYCPQSPNCLITLLCRSGYIKYKYIIFNPL